MIYCNVLSTLFFNQKGSSLYRTFKITLVLSRIRSKLLIYELLHSRQNISFLSSAERDLQFKILHINLVSIYKV